ncbi:MAG: right-handed parallel beta-helix repeat-containing protein [Armatimonadetes bacterium]|nr:right-handed parallel beta-helix repeat-containing protein [Armatimonadota bacterium]
MKMVGIVFVVFTLTCSVGFAAGRIFYVSSSLGDDRNDGLSPKSPWRSLEKVNAVQLLSGDCVLFKRGDVWRGQLIPQSGDEGAPIIYGAYGDGEKPLLLGSVARNSPSQWEQVGHNLWATTKPTFTELKPLSDFAASPWTVHFEGGAKVRFTVSKTDVDALPTVRIECIQSGTAPNHIQLYNHRLSLRSGDYFEFVFRIRCSKPFIFSRIMLMKQSAPWTAYGISPTLNVEVSKDWKDVVVRFKAMQTADDGRITLYLGGALPSGSVLEFQPLSWRRLRCNEAEELSLDVGNIIFDGGRFIGIKKWSLKDLKHQGEFWYDAQNWRVFMYSERNPAQLYKSIELALCRHIIDQSNKHHIVYENLSLRYGAAHGIGGGNTHHIIIRNCDISYIGGGHQFTTHDGRPVRYGNGVEFWGNAHDNLVEGCRIWEVYDAALTNQNNAPNVRQFNIIYRHNVIWNCEYSFEYWNRPESSETFNIRFEHNTCVNAGYGWGHSQRPDPNGRHLMFFFNSARTSEFYVRYNIFYNATESCLRMENDWRKGLIMDYNCWYQTKGILAQFLKLRFAPEQFEDYRKQTGLDAHSIFADPKFIDIGKLDFRLTQDSPARRLIYEGIPAGSSKRLTE